MVITLPNRPNTIPLVSAKQIDMENVSSLLLGGSTSHADVQPSEYYCDNHTNNGLLNEILNQRPFYDYLDREACKWNFALWLPVNRLLFEYGATRSPGVINVTINVVYVRMEVETGNVIPLALNVMTTSIAYIPDTTPFLPVPLHTLAKHSTADNPALIYPITIEMVDEMSEKHVYFYTTMPFLEGAVLTLPSEHVPGLELTLLNTKMSADCELYTQAWLLKTVHEDLNYTIRLEFFDAIELEFPLVVMRHQTIGYAPYLMTNIYVYTSEEQKSVDLEPIFVGT